jgi:hypothetical protein
MSAERASLDLEADVATTPEDVAVLRRLRAEAPGWFSLTPAELLALLPSDGLDGRPPTSPAALPFVLPPDPPMRLFPKAL